MYNIHKIGVHIKVKDFSKSEAFYKSLGFEEVFEYGPNKKIKEDYSGAVFEHNGGRIEIANGHRAVKTSVFKEPVKDSKISLMINVSSLSKVLDLVRKHNIPIAVLPRHYYWGTLEVVIKDPDGVVLVFIAPYTKKSAAKLNANESFAQNPIKALG